MSDYQEFTGKSVEEAIKRAIEAFGVGGLNDIDFEILTHGSKGVLGMGAEPARIVAAPRAALGGAAPRREAAAAQPLPSPAREDRGDRGPRDDRGGRDRRPAGDRDRRPGGDRDRRPDRAPRDAAPRDAAPRDAAPRDAAPIGAAETPIIAPSEPRSDRAPRSERPRDRDSRPGPRPASPGGLTDGEQEQVSAARASFAAEREEIQAADASPEALAAGKELLEQLMSLLGYDVTVTVEQGATSKLSVTGADSEKEALGILIGRKGDRLSALQHLVNLMLSKRMGAWTRVLVDVEEYRGRRERQLREIAERAAERVTETGKMLQLEPMTPLERRWIHIALRDRPGVATQSIGEEPNRRVVVLRREG
jgi:spoIIIJ-associated protein